MTSGADDDREAAGAPCSGALSDLEAWEGHEAIPGAEGSTGDPVRSARNPQTEALVHRDGPQGKRRVGRRGLEVIEKLAADGHTDTSVSKALRMNRRTFLDIRRRQPEVEEALVRGRSQLEDELVHHLLARARNPQDPTGMAAAAFLLKARCGYLEGRVPASAQLAVHGENVQIVVAPQLSREAFQALLDRGDG